jgi:hypothetical protein
MDETMTGLYIYIHQTRITAIVDDSYIVDVISILIVLSKHSQELIIVPAKSSTGC